MEQHAYTEIEITWYTIKTFSLAEYWLYGTQLKLLAWQNIGDAEKNPKGHACPAQII